MIGFLISLLLQTDLTARVFMVLPEKLLQFLARNAKSRKFIYMLSFFIEHSYFIFNYGPDNYVMSVLCKNNCKSCTPASCSDYTYFLHIYFAFCPNLFSVPFSNLDMLARCLHIAITVKQATTISNSKTYAEPIFISPL